MWCVVCGVRCGVRCVWCVVRGVRCAAAMRQLFKLLVVGSEEVESSGALVFNPVCRLGLGGSIVLCVSVWECVRVCMSTCAYMCKPCAYSSVCSYRGMVTSRLRSPEFTISQKTPTPYKRQTSNK